MRQIRPTRSKAHGFSAFSTALGVGLTLGILGALIAGALVVQELRRSWWASMAVQVVLEDGVNGDETVEKWMAEEAVAQDLLGIMVWYASVVNGLQYAVSWDASIVEDSQEGYIQALQYFENQ